MPATVTLDTTTLDEGVSATANEIKVASTSGMVAGTRLYVDGELMEVVRLLTDPWVYVRRGVDGTGGKEHASNLTIYIGEGHQFYGKDPDGRPPQAIAVSPYINVINGTVWFAQGDAESSTTDRWWQKQTTTYGTGALGVRTKTYEPESST